MTGNVFVDIVLLLGCIAIAIDLACGAQARASMRDAISRAWSGVRGRDFRATLRGGHEVAWRVMRRVLGPARKPLRFPARVAGASVLLALVSLALATGVMDVSWRDTLDRAMRYYALPTVVAGASALALLYLYLERVRAWGSPWRSVAALLAFAVALLVIWLAAMHAGTWHEWQYRRSAVGYGTPWFYAEVYHEYLVNGIGAAVSFALGLTLLIPIGAYALMLLGLLIVRLAAPLLAPASMRVAARLARSRRGAASVVVLIAVTVVLALSRCPSMGTGSFPSGQSASGSVVLVHVGTRVGNEAVAIRHLHVG